MKYIEFINGLIRKNVSEKDNLVLFGQNISTGSCLSGLTRHLEVKNNSMILNSTNSENVLTGVGFGLMINGVSSVFFMKQLDFLLLGMDHLVNTYNFIRRKDPNVSFTIMPCIVDHGYQGLQSSFNNFGDLCSSARIRGFTVTNKIDAEQIINSELVSPGFRIIGVSTRLFKGELAEIEKIYSNQNNTLFQYTQGNDVTIVCFNFSFQYGLELHNQMRQRGMQSSLFSVNIVTPTNWDKIIEDARNTKSLIIIDDSKSENLSCSALLNDALLKCELKHHKVIKRDMSKDWLSPNHDRLEIDYEGIMNGLLSNRNL